MNRKPPSFPFYAKDWKSSLTVRRMTPEQRGFYVQLLAEAWDSSEPGFIPIEAPVWWIAGAVSEPQFEPSREIVMSCFKRDNRGRYYSEKLVEVRKQQLEWREKCSAGGKKSRNLKSTKIIEIEDKVTSSIPVEVTVAKAKSKSKEQKQETEIPDYIAQDSWLGFVEMRVAKKAKLTPRATKMVLKSLADLKEAGEDVNAVLDQSTRNNWTDVYPVKPKFGGNGNGQYQSKAERISTGNKAAAAEALRMAAERDRQEALGFGHGNG